MKLFRLIVAFAIFSLAASAQSMPPADYSGPTRVDLSGLWDFRLDQKAEGEAQRWFAVDDTAPWSKLAVPGSFNELLSSDPGLPKTTDTMRFLKTQAWYRTRFATPVGTRRCVLHLSGTVLRHTVWVNGQAVGHSNRPYLEEAYDVTEKLRVDGPNVLVVMVDNTLPHFGVPDRNQHGWWTDGGLIRPVYLELRPKISAQSHVTTAMEGDGGWRLHVETVVSGAAAIRYTLADSAGKVVWSARTKATTSDVSLKGIKAWSPESPALYTLTTIVGEDKTAVRVGFRTIAVKGTQILLNGRPYLIRGVTRHQFLAGSGMSLSVADDRKDIEDIKALGANFVRLAHYTQSQDVFDACDELGLLVWTEIPAWQSNPQSLSDPAIWETATKPQLTGMVEQHRNHPSVVIWSVGNEIPTDIAEGAAYVAKAIAYVKTLDTSRLVAFASDRRVTDISFGPADVIAINEYYGWYYGKPDDVGPMLDTMHGLFPGKPILVSEFGADAVADWDKASAPAKSRDYSYGAQASFLQSHLEQIFARERRGFIAGAVIWVYNDFPDPHRVGGDHPVAANFRNNKGLVTMDRTHKPSYGVVQKFYRELSTAP